MSNGVLDLLLDVGAAADVDIIGDFIVWPGGGGDLFVTGELGGGSVELQATLDDGANVICVLSLPVKGISRFILNHGVKLRAALVDTTSTSSGVSARINT